MVVLDRTIRVDQTAWTFIEAARNLLESMMPTPVNQGTVADLGALLILKEFGEIKANLTKTPQGQVYLALAEALRQQAAGRSSLELEQE
jgi:hypothetical protein